MSNKKYLTYLVGAIQCADDDGLAWRKKAEEELGVIGWKAIIPNSAEIELKRNFGWDDLKKRNFDLFSKIMKKIIHQDIVGFTRSSNCIIFKWEGKPTYGSSHEIGDAFLNGIPVIIWTETQEKHDIPDWWCGCATAVVKTWDEVVEQLKFIELDDQIKAIVEEMTKK